MPEDPLQILERFCESLENGMLPGRNLLVETEGQGNPVDNTQGDNVTSSTNTALPDYKQDDVSSSTNAVLPETEPLEVDMATSSFQ